MAVEVNLKIEQYEGPLDLLLALISKHKIDIFDIPIAEICQQYNAYLDSMQKMDMEIAGEFIVMAAELMLIKSRMLLPKTEDEQDPRKVLVDALLEHQRAKQTAEYLKTERNVSTTASRSPPRSRLTRPITESTLCPSCRTRLQELPNDLPSNAGKRRRSSCLKPCRKSVSIPLKRKWTS